MQPLGVCYTFLTSSCGSFHITPKTLFDSRILRHLGHERGVIIYQLMCQFPMDVYQRQWTWKFNRVLMKCSQRVFSVQEISCHGRNRTAKYNISMNMRTECSDVKSKLVRSLIIQFNFVIYYFMLWDNKTQNVNILFYEGSLLQTKNKRFTGSKPSNNLDILYGREKKRKPLNTLANYQSYRKFIHIRIKFAGPKICLPFYLPCSHYLKRSPHYDSHPQLTIIFKTVAKDLWQSIYVAQT